MKKKEQLKKKHTWGAQDVSHLEPLLFSVFGDGVCSLSPS